METRKCRLCNQQVEHNCSGNHWCNPLKRKGTWKGLLDGFGHHEKCSVCGSDQVVARRSLPGNREAYYCLDCYQQNRRPKSTKISPFQVFVSACYKRR